LKSIASICTTVRALASRAADAAGCVDADAADVDDGSGDARVL